MSALPVEVVGGPFTIEHFREWASELILDSDERWELEDFQAEFAEDVFSGRTACWLVVPEGNGKTTLLAGLALYHCEFTPAARIPVAASARDQAEVMYQQAEGFVLRTPRLSKIFRCFEGYRRIKCITNRSRIQIFAADEKSGDGVIPTLAIIDELHRHKSLGLYRTWLGKLGKRGGQVIVISTAGEPGSEFEEVREQMRSSAVDLDRAETFVRAAKPNSVLHDWAVPEDADVEDLELVARANPFSGVTVETLAEKLELPGMTRQHWSRLTCNLPTRGTSAAITEQEWFAARTDERIPEGQDVWLGLDLGWKYDTTAMVPLWIRDPEFRLFGPATVLEPPRNGQQLDAHLVEAALLNIHERNPVHTVVMDMTNGAQLSQWIMETLGAEVVDRTQVNSLACLDYARFMEALREGWLHHAGDPGLTSHALNAVARVLPQGDTKFERPKESRTVRDELARRRVIDALVAASMVHTSAAATLGRSEEPAFAWA